MLWKNFVTTGIRVVRPLIALSASQALTPSTRPSPFVPVVAFVPMNFPIVRRRVVIWLKFAGAVQSLFGGVGIGSGPGIVGMKPHLDSHTIVSIAEVGTQ